jgi:ferrous iron transport protein B
MSCTAKIPIYAFFASAFFPRHAAWVMMSLYVLGILVGIVVALVMKRTLFRGEAVPFVMELPNYRLPGVRNVTQLLWEKSKDFIQRAFSVILIATIVVWFLSHFDFGLNLTQNSHDSMLASIAGILEPVMAPVGLGDWRIITSLISGFMAKESVVGTIGVLFPGDAGLYEIMTPSLAFVFLVFSLLYTPCVAAIAAVRRELGGKWALNVVILQCVVAWLVAFLAHLLLSAF